MRGITGWSMIALILGVGSLRAEDAPKPPPMKDQAMQLRRLAKPLPDRGPFVDPARDTAAVLVLKAPMPSRKRPVPYATTDLPNPYERREMFQFRTMVAEDATPATRYMGMPKR
jgi:hypothetical protein